MTTAADPSLRLRYLPGAPTPKQAAVLSADRPELLVHGAGGGGKTWGLLAGALQYADVPGYHALILRRTYTDLVVPGGLLDMSAWWLAGHPGAAVFNARERKWTFESGATLSFGYLGERPDETAARYRGGEWQFVGIDMAEEFPGRVDEDDPDAGPVHAPAWFLFLFSKLRRPFPPTRTRPPLWSADDGTTLADVPLRMRLTAGDLRTPVDPDDYTPGRLWVRHRYIDGPEPRPASIATSYQDNPLINPDEYDAALVMLSEDERRRLT